MKSLFLFILSSFFYFCGSAQEAPEKRDTFFLAKKKGLVGRLAQSIATDGVEPIETVVANPYLVHVGKKIRSIHILRLGFERDINDTAKISNKFGAIVANAFHKKTTQKVVKNNLFFEEGNSLNPFLLADNERHLREQPFVQDARILVKKIKGSIDSVDIIILLKDVFSLGGDLDIGSPSQYRVGLKEENFAGSGSRFGLSIFYDGDRNPKTAFGADFLKRNIKGSFINFNTGFRSYNGAFNSGRREETTIYLNFEKPLVSPYIPWIGSLDLSVNNTKNAYLRDSLYKSDFKYSYHRFDGWFGYNFGSRNLKTQNIQQRLRKFIAIRGLYQHFTDIPAKSRQLLVDYQYTNISGVLGSMNIFKQNFTRSNFIYGFGRNEDVPEGFSASLIGGWANQKDSINKGTRERGYYGIEAQRSHYNKKGFYTNYILRLGGFRHEKNWEDMSFLFSVEHFTKLKKLSPRWYNRNFFGLSATKQHNPVLNAPLYLNSAFGLGYFPNPIDTFDFRGTIKGEAVFFNMKKFLGFRFAPFIFSDFSILKPTQKSINSSKWFGAIGGGVRTRNENLIFGTIELKGYFFPNILPGMQTWRVELNSEIRFKYNSVFIKRPDFVLPN
jgi:hypothetical protein